MRTRDPAKSWSNSYFFVRNGWGLVEKWGKMRDLPAPLHVGEDDMMRLLKVLDIEHLLYEVRYLNKYIEEEFLFNVGLSFHPRRSDARMLKLTSKVPKPPIPVPKAVSKRQVGGEDPQVLLKKKKLDGAAVNTSKVAPVSSPVKFRVPGDVLSHQCVRRRKADDLKYNQKTKEAKVLEEELCGCRTELANIVQSVSLKNQQIDHLQVDLERAQATIIQLREDQRANGEKVAVLEAENKRS
ncbi:hypothetical protein IEQ34_001157 [Dendrobium chrysotoxum]|uniref:Uncharacterized protein n=1 Tax=Dendrobium chrysotoxum TaxID=161865 RepID=A0AAV7HMW5_DENCH|nr:hypothetical protein IEQ34_001157 [Dendrobium chrysotoxum]